MIDLLQQMRDEDYDKLERKYHDILTKNKFIMWLGEAKKNYVIQ